MYIKNLLSLFLAFSSRKFFYSTRLLIICIYHFASAHSSIAAYIANGASHYIHLILAQLYEWKKLIMKTQLERTFEKTKQSTNNIRND